MWIYDCTSKTEPNLTVDLFLVKTARLFNSEPTMNINGNTLSPTINLCKNLN
jgi:hypothetical protein